MARRGILSLALPITAMLVGAAAGCAAQPPQSAQPASPAAASSPVATPTAPAVVALPPAGATPDYQLGGAYPPPPGVGIVARDRTAVPADGLYSVCYVNAFQTQPGERDLWPASLLLTDADGEPVRDPDWPDEVIVDTTDAEGVASVVGPWIEGCATDGFDAVEFDNLDTYTRTSGALRFADNLETARLLVDLAHRHGLAAGQKNAAEDAAELHQGAGFDFAVVEECAAYEECGAYTAVYGDAVVAIEYTDNLPRPFAEVCADAASPSSLVLRDRDLVAADDPAYVFETCD